MEVVVAFDCPEACGCSTTLKKLIFASILEPSLDTPRACLSP